MYRSILPNNKDNKQPNALDPTFEEVFDRRPTIHRQMRPVYAPDEIVNIILTSGDTAIGKIEIDNSDIAVDEVPALNYDSYELMEIYGYIPRRDELL